MKIRLLGNMCVSVFVLVISTHADAALVDRGGGLIYDTDQDITWLQNANASGNIPYAGSAIAWADGFVYYDPIRNVDWADWRLPKDDFSCFGPFNCSTSEMGHLFYVDGVTFSNQAPFFNLQSGGSDFYWFGTPTGNDWYRTFTFFSGGTTLDVSFHDPTYAWAVRDGDVIPIPAAFWLFCSGLLGLIGLSKYRAG